MKIRYCIPSFNRPDSVITPTNLELEDYTIFVHTEEQAELYRKHHSNVVVTNAEGITGQRNFILNFWPAGEKIIFCDDDIKGIFRKSGKELEPLNKEQLETLIDKSFTFCEKNNLHLWGVYPVANSFYMKSQRSYRAFIIGTFCGCITSDIRIDTNLKVKEDYDFTLQHILKDSAILRQDNYTVKAGHYTKGGCDYLREINSDKEAKEYLKLKYPRFVKDNPRSPNEILLKFPTRGRKC